MGKCPDHRPTNSGYSAFHRLRLDSSLETGAGDDAPAYFLATKHLVRLLGQCLPRRALEYLWQALKLEQKERSSLILNEVYYLPIWFQAIDGVSAVDSGIHLLPMLLSLVLGSMFSGLGITKVGYYTPFLLIGIAITAVGAGLITTFNVDTTEGQWIGYQIVYGFGFGACSQVPNMAAQTVLKRDEVPIGATLMFFGLQLAGAIFTSIGDNVLDNQLVSHFKEILLITPAEISSAGVTNVLELVPENLLPQARVAYNDSVREVFRVGLVVACISILGALAMEWVSVKKNIKKKPVDEAGDKEKGVPWSSRGGSTNLDGVMEPES